jgi:hypothetical protein
LGEGEAEEVVERRKSLDLVIAPIALHATTKLGQGKQVHELRKNRASGIHQPLPTSNLEWRKSTCHGKSISMFFMCKLMSLLNLATYREAIVGQY